MAYTKTEWKPRKGIGLSRFEKFDETSRFVTLENAPQRIDDPGTPFDPDNMNKIEQGISDAHKGLADEEKARTKGDADTLAAAKTDSANKVSSHNTSTTAHTDIRNSKQDKLNRTVVGNDNATSAVTDTGGNLSIAVPVTVAAPAASATQITAGTRTLRATLKILIDNIANLFSRMGTAETRLTTAETNISNEVSARTKGDADTLTAAKTDSTSKVSSHNTSTTAHADIRAIINNCVGLPTYNSSSHVITFTDKSGATVKIDLPLEGLAQNLEYDAATKEIILTKQDGTQTRISVSDLIDVYTGSTGTHIQVTIGSNNVISAVLRAGTITETQLAAALLSKINGKQDALNRTVVGSDNATAAVTDTGGNLSIAVPVTVAAPSASATQITAGTRTLRATLKILIDNIANLFSRMGTAETNIANKQGALNRTVVGNDNATAAVTDTGGNLSIAVPVTVVDPVRSATQTTAGTRTLRATLKILIDNIAELFASKLTKTENVAPSSVTESNTKLTTTGSPLTALFGNIHSRANWLITQMGKLIRPYLAVAPANYSSRDASAVSIKIKLPVAANSGLMLSFTVRIYSSYETADIQCSGYLYSTANNWHSPKAVMIAGTVSASVTFWKDTDNRACVSIKLPSANYAGVGLFNVTGGYSTSVTSIDSGWEITRSDTMINIVSTINLKSSIEELDAKQDKLNRTVQANDNATGSITDTGGNLSIPVSVTTAVPARSATQTSAGTRSLRAQIKILIDNIAELFASKLTKTENIAPNSVAESSTKLTTTGSPLTTLFGNIHSRVNWLITNKLNEIPNNDIPRTQKTMADATNLNSIITPGWYGTNSSSSAATMVNRPTGLSTAFNMLVEYAYATNAASVRQTIFLYNSDTSYVRNLYNTAWSAWVQKPTRAQVDGKQAALNRTVIGNDNATSAVTDTGGALSIPVPVTVAAPSASATQITAGTRTLRATLKILIDNIANLFSRLGTAETNIANKLNTSAMGAANGVAGLGADGKVPASQLPTSATGVTSVLSNTTGGRKSEQGLIISGAGIGLAARRIGPANYPVGSCILVSISYSPTNQCDSLVTGFAGEWRLMPRLINNPSDSSIGSGVTIRGLHHCIALAVRVS